ncbi:MAG: hypothetical protein KC656_22680 [Myxococcales bacterium]|nr:hypothetical protein [Myxococcales bacterium]
MVAWLLGSVSLANPYGGGGLSIPSAAPEVAPFHWEVPERAVGSITLVLTVPKDHAVYQDAVAIEAVRGRIGEPVYPEARLAPDPYEPGSWRASWSADVRVEVPVEAADAGVVELRLTHQGCRAGLCWPIEVSTHTVHVALPVEERRESP